MKIKYKWTSILCNGMVMGKLWVIKVVDLRMGSLHIYLILGYIRSLFNWTYLCKLCWGILRFSKVMCIYCKILQYV